MAMQYRYITETNDPFRGNCKFCKINFINDPHSTITASCTHDGFNGPIIQHLLQVGQAFFIRATECEIFFPYCITNFKVVAPFFHFIYCGLNVFCCNKPCRTRDTDSISFFEIRWD